MEIAVRSPRLLIVEDCAADALLLRKFLAETLGSLKIFHANDGEEAINFLFRKGPFLESPRPDQILLDLGLPKISGHQVLKSIKVSEDLKNIPVDVLTSSESALDRDMSYLLGARSFLTKPNNLEGFKNLARNIGLHILPLEWD